jgi:tetratricopeptide (TPR) repeat protein
MRKITIITLAAALATAAGMPAQAGWDEGVAALKANKLDQAQREFQEVVAKQPDWPGGHFMLGQVYLQQGKAQEAVASLRKANELEPGKPSYQFSLGQAYLKAGRYADASQILKKINPSSLTSQQQSAYHQMMAVAADKMGDSGGALAALKQTAQSKSNDATAWYSYGIAAFNSGDTATGVTALAKSVQLDGNDAAKKSAYARALIRLGREKGGSAKQDAYTKAVGAARSVAAQNGSYDNLMLLGEAQLGAKEYDGAADTFGKAAAKKSNDWLAYYYLAQAQTALGRYNPAESSARTALSRASSATDKSRVWKQIGFVNEKLKNYDEAIIAYRNAGDSAGVGRVEENKRIVAENREIEEHNRELEELEEQQRKLEEELKGLPGGGGGGGGH